MQQSLLQWGHNLLLINKKLSDEATYFYATESFNQNWSRDFLLNAIKMNSYELNRNKLRDNNFSETVSAIQAEQANAILKDSYNLGFLGVTEPISELELEKRLIEKIKTFMLELGKGFAFIEKGNCTCSINYNINPEDFIDIVLELEREGLITDSYICDTDCGDNPNILKYARITKTGKDFLQDNNKAMNLYKEIKDWLSIADFI